VNPIVSLVTVLGFLVVCLSITAWIFKTGYKLKN